MIALINIIIIFIMFQLFMIALYKTFITFYIINKLLLYPYIQIISTKITKLFINQEYEYFYLVRRILEILIQLLLFFICLLFFIFKYDESIRIIFFIMVASVIQSYRLEQIE